MKNISKRIVVCGLIAVILALVFTACEEPDTTPPDLTGTVTISNTTPAVGDTLIATYNPGNGSGTATWQWLANDAAISGANSSIYNVASGDQGKMLKARVSYSNQNGSITSNATSAVASLTKSALTGTVTIDNTNPKVGDTLTASYTGGNGSGTPTWQWLSGVDPVGTNSNIYVVANNDLNKILKAQVSYSNQNGNVTSDPTDAVTTQPYWSEWTAIDASTDQRVCTTDSSHIEQRLTGTNRFTFEAIDITSYRVRKGTATTGEVIIPAYYRLDANSNFLLVTEIGSVSDDRPYWSENGYTDSDGAFASCVGITGITIPASVVSIGNYAFHGCTSLTNITIPASVSSIGEGAFAGVDFYYFGDSRILYRVERNNPMSLTTVTFAADSQLQTIGDAAFTLCENLTSITIPNNVTSIGDFAFTLCESLTNITIPNSVTSIGNSVFALCKSLTSIMVAANNQNYSSEGGILYNKAKAEIIFVPKGINAVTISDVITSIGSHDDDYNFYSPFDNCTSLTSITIPASVTTISHGAFSGCKNLTSITIAVNNPNYSSENGILYNKAKTEIISVPKGIDVVTISVGVTSIDGYVRHTTYGPFRDHTNLTSITIPASVTTIGEYAFDGCINLTSVTFATGSNITSTNFGEYAFPDGRYIGVDEDGYEYNYCSGGNNLKTAYLGGGAGTYTRSEEVEVTDYETIYTYTWTKQ